MGAGPNVVSSSQNTALTLAALNGHREATDELMRAGANPRLGSQLKRYPEIKQFLAEGGWL
jgi:ankyrin repeat protein